MLSRRSAIVGDDGVSAAPLPSTTQAPSVALDAAWNEALAATTESPDDDALLALIEAAIRDAASEADLASAVTRVRDQPDRRRPGARPPRRRDLQSRHAGRRTSDGSWTRFASSPTAERFRSRCRNSDFEFSPRTQDRAAGRRSDPGRWPHDRARGARGPRRAALHARSHKLTRNRSPSGGALVVRSRAFRSCERCSISIGTIRSPRPRPPQRRLGHRSPSERRLGRPFRRRPSHAAPRLRSSRSAPTSIRLGVMHDAEGRARAPPARTGEAARGLPRRNRQRQDHRRARPSSSSCSSAGSRCCSSIARATSRGTRARRGGPSAPTPDPERARAALRGPRRCRAVHAGQLAGPAAAPAARSRRCRTPRRRSASSSPSSPPDGLAAMMGYGRGERTSKHRQSVLQCAIELHAEERDITLDLLTRDDQSPRPRAAPRGRQPAASLRRPRRGSPDPPHPARLAARRRRRGARPRRARCRRPASARGCRSSTPSALDRGRGAAVLGLAAARRARRGSRASARARTLQAAAFFDEADAYIPAIGSPPTKEPMFDLLRRARSAGIGVLLATQNPGDFDYKARDNIATWLRRQGRAGPRDREDAQPARQLPERRPAPGDASRPGTSSCSAGGKRARSSATAR